MKDGSSHVGKLTQLTIGNGGNDFRILDDTRIGYQETGNIGPVLVGVSVYGSFATMKPVISDPPRRRFLRLPSVCAVESRNDCVVRSLNARRAPCQSCLQRKFSVLVGSRSLLRINYIPDNLPSRYRSGTLRDGEVLPLLRRG